MSSFVDEMKERAVAEFDCLHRGVSSLAFLDFPDHTNVGDSAIALGQFAYWRSSNIDVEAVFPGPAAPKYLIGSSVPVVLQGGGSFGGLYPPMDKLRLQYMQDLDSDTLLIQLPQSVHFVSTNLERAYRKAMTDRANLRIAARDLDSHETLRGLGFESGLAPDAVHLLGGLRGPLPDRPIVTLARTDRESEVRRRSLALGGRDTIDWNPGTVFRRALHRGKYQFGIPEFVRPLLRKDPAHWERVAKKRLVAGLRMLGVGETIVTDRLHAMLLGLQMGRRVVAVDNTTSKLSAYANTWLAETDAPLDFADTFDQALRIARRGGSL